MADLSSVASITGVAAAGFRLSLILNAVSCEVANAGLEVHSISKGVTLFSTMLKQTGHVLQSADSVHSHEAVETAKSIADESTRVFDEINDMLDRVQAKPVGGSTGGGGTTVPTIQQRFRWCFKKHRVTYLLAQLESLKLSLSVMLQIIQLGKLMASTSRSDPPDEVAMKTEAIRQERAETQNSVIVRYWQMSKMDRLFEASQKEDDDDRQVHQAHLAADAMHDGAELALVATNDSHAPPDAPPPEYAPSTALVKLPVYSLGELDQTLHQIKGSPRDMIRVSDQAIDPLLERWTNWREIRERRHTTRDPAARYYPSVHSLEEEDEDRAGAPDRFRDGDDYPRGYYLEGVTSDWRKPHSAEARYEAARRRQQYARYQASVSAASSDVEDSPGSNGSKKRPTKRHVIDSGSDSSTSDHDPSPRLGQRRRSSDSPAHDRKAAPSAAAAVDGAPMGHSYTAPVPPPPHWVTANTSSAGRAPSVGSGQSIASRLSSPAYHPPGHRPWATPEQTAMHHSYSSPLPPIHTANAPNPYAPPPAPGPTAPPAPAASAVPLAGAGAPRYPGQLPPLLPAFGPPGAAQARYIPPSPNRMGPPPRPVSQDGKSARSPSRMSQYGGRHAKDKSTRQNLKEGATKGLLGAGAIAGFLEALEGLSI